MFLIGLIHGHWNLPENQVDHESDENLWGRHEKINVGIAMVVPAHKIKEVLEHPELLERERHAEDALYGGQPNVLDGGSPVGVKKGCEEIAAHQLATSGTMYEVRNK